MIVRDGKEISLPDLKEHTVYLVHAKRTKPNLIHQAILFMGFHSGSYCFVYDNSYDRPEPFENFFYIDVIRELCTIHPVQQIEDPYWKEMVGE